MKDEDQEPTPQEAFVRIPWELAEGEGMPIEEAKALRLVVSEFEDCGDRFRLEKGDTPEAVLSDARMLLRMRRMEWEETRNPVAVIEAIIIAYKAGLFPPLWALRWLCEGLEAWHAGNGQEPLEKVLGLRPEGKGKRPAFKEALQAGFLSRIREDVWLLRHLGFTLEQAAEMVARAMEAEEKEKGDLDKTGWGVAKKALSPETIERLCKGNDPFADSPPEVIERWKAQKDVILRRFSRPPPTKPHRG